MNLLHFKNNTENLAKSGRRTLGGLGGTHLTL